jgi:hypothetical protein
MLSEKETNNLLYILNVCVFCSYNFVPYYVSFDTFENERTRHKWERNPTVNKICVCNTLMES